MNPLYTVAEIRAIEYAAAARLPPGALMQRAGQAGANAALDLLPFTTAQAKVLVLAGPGNNGGDALETAAHLAHAGAQVTILHFDTSAAPSEERALAMQRARSSDAVFADIGNAAIAATDWKLVIDGLFGIGLKRPLAGAMRALVETINALRCPVLALDVPSGLDADTGAVVGPDGVAVRATHTITFIGDKPGLHTCDGRDVAGLVDTSRLDLEAATLRSTRLYLNDEKFFARQVRAPAEQQQGQLRQRRHRRRRARHGRRAYSGRTRGAHQRRRPRLRRVRAGRAGLRSHASGTDVQVGAGFRFRQSDAGGRSRPRRRRRLQADFKARRRQRQRAGGRRRCAQYDRGRHGVAAGAGRARRRQLADAASAGGGAAAGRLGGRGAGGPRRGGAQAVAKIQRDGGAEGLAR